jgi:hypothetical protein
MSVGEELRFEWEVGILEGDKMFSPLGDIISKQIRRGEDPF